ncbi:MAG TPA: cyclic nucleotide-binding domain-containing protein [Gemmataceae bacterium]|jgi:Fe-S-cluster-containing hydrogenase component 2/CRP-like cAMP-binding protein|nr:cyclic nucleotide-binding domain-containing protein [Gemmataceae bacterium]
MADVPALDLIPTAREGEALFARGDDDALIRRERKTQADFDQRVTLTIDGVEITVPRATPVTDAQGNVKFGPDGNPIPRATTIYDAATAIRQWDRDGLARRIPVLCHQDHLTPVAVCRMCSVHVSKLRKRDKGNPNARPIPAEKLVPACQHEVQDDMIVTTRCGGVQGKDSERFAAQVGRAAGLLTELLLADHRHPDPARDDRFRNELEAVGAALNIDYPRPGIERQEGRNVKLHVKSRPIPLEMVDAGNRELPYSSRSIQVDHDRCILCDRCVRSCSEVKPFKVIGHTGKGYQTRISFDLDQLMNESSCVQCGECMTACPTGALTLNRRVNPLRSFADAGELESEVPRSYRPPAGSGDHPRLAYYDDPARPLPAEFPAAVDLQALALPYLDEANQSLQFRPFSAIPFAYLRWNEGAVRLRKVKAGDVLCKQGEFGSTAFLLKEGTFDIWVTPKAPASATGLLGRLLSRRTSATAPIKVFTASAGRDLILGEMACLTNTARTATITAAGDGVVLEVTRNLLMMLQRIPTARTILDRVYRGRAIDSCLRRGKLFASLTGEQRETVLRELRAVATLVRVDPGEIVVRQGDTIGLDDKGVFRGDFYTVRLGSVKVARTAAGVERVLARLGPDDYFGEIALLCDDPRVAPLLPPGYETRRRTASVTALDDVEVVRIPGEAVRQLGRRFPEIGEALASQCAESLRQQQAPRPPRTDLLATFLDQGFYQGQKMLVLDLESCTRCDECTRACADAHGDGHSRLLREGPRFGQFLVATSCRSCHTPYCMEGCPVDAIHRGATSLEVRIDSHCIGCSLCSTNCPYESIQMVPRDGMEERRVAAVAQRAVNCDLCHGLVPDNAEPFCVSACPHEAAFRWDGNQLLAKVVQ